MHVQTMRPSPPCTYGIFKVLRPARRRRRRREWLGMGQRLARVAFAWLPYLFRILTIYFFCLTLYFFLTLYYFVLTIVYFFLTFFFLQGLRLVAERYAVRKQNVCA